MFINKNKKKNETIPCQKYFTNLMRGILIKILYKYYTKIPFDTNQKMPSYVFCDIGQ